MLTNEEIQHLKKELLSMEKSVATTEKNTRQDQNLQESSGELSMYDNHPADLGTELFEQEKEHALHEQAESLKAKILRALQAIDKGTYGNCEVCHRAIPYERLIAVPYTTLCFEHAEMNEQTIEKEAIINQSDDPFKKTSESDVADYENSFEEVAEFGTSDSPSDFIDPSIPTYQSAEDEDGH